LSLYFTSDRPNQDDLFGLYRELAWADFLSITPEQLHKAMEQSYIVISAYENNKLVGPGRVVSDGIITAYICGVGVLPKYRCKGIGTEILNRLKLYCLERNIHTQLVCKDDLVSYYSRMGFEKFAVAMKIPTKSLQL